MTYTTEERIAVEKVRSASKMDVITLVSDRKQIYDDATREQRATLQTDIAAIKTAVKDKLAIDIADTIDGMRADTYNGGENDE